MELPRGAYAELESNYVEADGTCGLSGEGVDEEFLEVLAVVGPAEKEDGNDVPTCMIVVSSTEWVWDGDEFDVYITDGNSDNDLNAKITVVSWKEDERGFGGYDSYGNYFEYDGYDFYGYYSYDFYGYDYYDFYGYDYYDYDYGYYSYGYDYDDVIEWRDEEEARASEGWEIMETRAGVTVSSGNSREILD
jgi:hypothetical protein